MDRYRVIAKFAKQNNWTQGLELGVWVGCDDILHDEGDRCENVLC